MTSLRWRVFLILAVATGAIWLGAAGWIYVHTKAEIERVLDTRLREAARMVGSLVTAGDAQMQGAVAAPLAHPELLNYQRQLACQIWSLDGRLVARSAGAPDANLSEDGSGFSERTINGETWRIYAVQDADKGLRILVGDRLGLRERLVGDLMRGLMAPAAVVAPLLGFLIWASIRGGLRPLQSMATELQSRGADDMRPILVDDAPAEIKPIARALNGLFAKVEAARRHEREVTAFAAHELRTPLAGLKTQAQVVIAAADPEARERALRQILLAVERTTRLVRQLLVLAKLDAGLDLERAEDVEVGELLEEIVDDLEPASKGRRVEVEPALCGTTVRANRELLTLALRNLHENAVIHTPSGGKVRWGAARAGAILFVEDEGPGIPEEELPLVTQRFFRGRHKSALGSGLGLAIVHLAVRRSGATLHLRNRDDTQGLRAEIQITAVCS
ncbi:MAG: two-component sensor histidine kinase [Hyphomicrobiales bacterium]|nr:MAG: two-component sensor histidine kinase [Hyphomicrobiales bacterium]